MARNVYYGWWIVAGLFVVLTVSSGFGFYNLSVYMNVLSGRGVFSVPEMSLAISLFFVVGGLAGMLVARLIDRYDVRLVMVAGAALGGVALGCLGMVRSLWELYLLFALFGIGNSGISIVTSTTLVTRWFPGANRSVALSIASTGLSAGGVVLTPLSAWLLASHPLGAVAPGFGVVFFLVPVVVALCIIRSAPPVAADGPAPPAGETPEWTYRTATRTRFFVLLTAGYVLCMGAQVGGIAHLYNRAELAVDYSVAALAVQTLTVLSILGRFVGGWLVTRMSIRTFALVCLAGQGAGLAVIGLGSGEQAMLLGAGLFGATVGNLLMLQPLWLADAFGVRAYPRIFSLSNAITVVGVAGGPALLGLVYDTSDYRAAYLAAVLACVLAWVLMSAAGARPRAEQSRRNDPADVVSKPGQ